MELQNQYVLENLETETTWSAKVGPSYNPVSSTKYWTTLFSDGIREFGHEAPALGGWLSGLNNLPIPANWTKGTIIHSAQMLFDGSIIDWTKGSRIACEFDNRVADGKGNNFNFSNQFNLSEDWMWQVDNQTGKWTNVVKITPLTPFTWHDISFENEVDFETLKLSFISLTTDDIQYKTSSAFYDLTPMKDLVGHSWSLGSNLQIQMCRQTAGVALLYARNIRVKFIPQ